MQFSWTPREGWEPGTTGWAVRATTYGSEPGTIATGLTGDTVLVEAKSGKTKHVTLGRQIAVQKDGKYVVYAVADQEKPAAAKPGGTMTRYQNDWAPAQPDLAAELAPVHLDVLLDRIAALEAKVEALTVELADAPPF
jgi:hypothetical protein